MTDLRDILKKIYTHDIEESDIVQEILDDVSLSDIETNSGLLNFYMLSRIQYELSCITEKLRYIDAELEKMNAMK